MAPESCNYGEDEAETIKPSSPQSSSPSSSSSSISPLPPLSITSTPQLLSLGSLLRTRRSNECQQISTTDTTFETSSMAKHGEEPHLPVQMGNRCLICQKRVGLTGFRCRCGDLYCARHRYSDTHECTFDYKAAGREEIIKANPVIRAAKIIKI